MFVLPNVSDKVMYIQGQTNIQFNRIIETALINFLENTIKILTLLIEITK